VRKLKLFLSESDSLTYEIRRRLSRGKLPRLLRNRTNSKYFNHSARRINRIMFGKNYKYLEIGVADGTTLQSVNSRDKHGVDPFPLFNTSRLPYGTTFDTATSNSYFDSISKDEKYDFIFLDGLHESNQLFLDFINAIKHISIPGWILIDDMVPSDSISAIPSMENSYKARGVAQSEGFPWHGDCYKLFPTILNHFPKIEAFLIMYPDNPQLLLRINQEVTSHEINQINLITETNFFEVFSSNKLKQYPIYIEEILIKELSDRGLIEKHP